LNSAVPATRNLSGPRRDVTILALSSKSETCGAAEFNGYNRDIREDRIRPLTKWVETHFPAVSTEEVVPWAGLRPMMPSMMPRVGQGRSPRVFYNTGHGHLGWTLSAATAEIVAADVARVRQAARGAVIGGAALA
ncbi:MAG: FAD-dependent oxidoreductase, partial [Pseudomonadota bacterium]